MSRAFARPAIAQAIARPWVKPQAGVRKERRTNRDGSITVTRIETDARGVVRRYVTTVVPN